MDLKKEIYSHLEKQAKINNSKNKSDEEISPVEEELNEKLERKKKNRFYMKDIVDVDPDANLVRVKTPHQGKINLDYTHLLDTEQEEVDYWVREYLSEEDLDKLYSCEKGASQRQSALNPFEPDLSKEKEEILEEMTNRNIAMDDAKNILLSDEGTDIAIRMLKQDYPISKIVDELIKDLPNYMRKSSQKRQASKAALDTDYVQNYFIDLAEEFVYEDSSLTNAALDIVDYLSQYYPSGDVSWSEIKKLMKRFDFSSENIEKIKNLLSDDLDLEVSASKRQAEYHGWTNWETWNTYNWMTSYESIYKSAVGASIEELKMLFDNIEGIKTDDINKSKVNWQELKEAFDEYTETSKRQAQDNETAEQLEHKLRTFAGLYARNNKILRAIEPIVKNVKKMYDKVREKTGYLSLKKKIRKQKNEIKELAKKLDEQEALNEESQHYHKTLNKISVSGGGTKVKMKNKSQIEEILDKLIEKYGENNEVLKEFKDEAYEEVEKAKRVYVRLHPQWEEKVEIDEGKFQHEDIEKMVEKITSGKQKDISSELSKQSSVIDIIKSIWNAIKSVYNTVKDFISDLTSNQNEIDNLLNQLDSSLENLQKESSSKTWLK